MADRDANSRALLVLASVLALAIPYVLYLGRALDDNRLTSWQWIFDSVPAIPVFMAISVAVVIAYFLSARDIPSSGVLALAGFVTGAYLWQEPEVIVDASRYFTQAKHLSQYGIGFFIDNWGGEIGAVWLTAKVADELFPESGHAGGLAGLMLLSMPYLYSQVPLMLVDVACMFFLMLGMFFLQRALDRGGALYVVLSGLVIGLMLLTKYSQWVFASLYFVLFLTKLVQSPGAVARRGLAAAGIAIAVLGAFLLAYQDVVGRQVELLLSYQRPGLRRWGESNLSTLFFQIHPFVTLAALGSLYPAIKKRDARWIVAVWLLVMLLALMRVERSRYILPALPMLAITASYALSALKNVRLGRNIAYIAACVSLALVVSAYLPYLKGNSMGDLMQAGRYLDENMVDEARAYALPQRSEVNPAVSVPLLDLYTQADITYRYNLKPALGSERLERTPMRFTWDYRNPRYYEPLPGRHPASAVVISFWEHERNVKRLPDGFELLERFETSEGVFRFKPFVSIYGKVPEQ